MTEDGRAEVPANRDHRRIERSAPSPFCRAFREKLRTPARIQGSARNPVSSPISTGYAELEALLANGDKANSYRGMRNLRYLREGTGSCSSPLELARKNIGQLTVRPLQNQFQAP